MPVVISSFLRLRLLFVVLMLKEYKTIYFISNPELVASVPQLQAKIPQQSYSKQYKFLFLLLTEAEWAVAEEPNTHHCALNDRF